MTPRSQGAPPSPFEAQYARARPLRRWLRLTEALLLVALCLALACTRPSSVVRPPAEPAAPPADVAPTQAPDAEPG
ncbi:MAG: hypothetical protein AAGN66_19300, partial [Acidobacteriota bacterium]